MEFAHTVEALPAYDKRDPDPAKSYGIGSVEMRFTAIGDNVAACFTLYTHWFLPHVQKEYLYKYPGDPEQFLPLPAYIDIHSRTQSPGHVEVQPTQDMCPYLHTSYCYMYRYALLSDDAYNELVVGGLDALWRFLEKLCLEEKGLR